MTFKVTPVAIEVAVLNVYERSFSRREHFPNFSPRGEPSHSLQADAVSNRLIKSWSFVPHFIQSMTASIIDSWFDTVVKIAAEFPSLPC
jgi:hypothetical protein